MSTLIAVLCVGAGALLAVDGLWRAHRSERHLASISRAWTEPAPPEEPAAWLDRVVARRVLVHLVTDETIEGLLVTVADDGIVLTGATYLGNVTSSLGGDVWVPRAKIRLVQLAPPAD